MDFFDDLWLVNKADDPHLPLTLRAREWVCFRCSLQSQDAKGALNSYRQYLTRYPASERDSEIALRIQEIEGKMAAGNAAK